METLQTTLELPPNLHAPHILGRDQGARGGGKRGAAGSPKESRGSTPLSAPVLLQICPFLPTPEGLLKWHIITKPIWLRKRKFIYEVRVPGNILQQCQFSLILFSPHVLTFHQFGPNLVFFTQGA